MSSLAFDTHRGVKTLCEAGAAEPLAEAFVETIGDAITGNVATKADIKASEVANVRAELKTDIGLVRAEIGAVQGEIGGLEARLYQQLWLMAAGIVGLPVAMVKLLG